LRAWRITLISLVFVLAPAAWGETGERNAEYDTLVAKAASGQDVDFGALREAYAQSPDYQPYSWNIAPIAREMSQAANGGDCQKAIGHALTILKMNFTFSDAHFMLAYCSKKAGDAAAEDKEAKIAIGLLKSILASGDGKTPQTAFRVVTISEEYSVLKILRLQKSLQRLISHEGHAYDVLEAKGNGDQTVNLYFSVDGILAHANRSLHPKQ
jgi:hypothetical protein